jgi:tetratricopeptide (TPR) repeat protein
LLAQAKKKVLDKDYKGAVSLLSEALVLDPENGDAKFYRALSQLDSGMHQESINEFREMISNQTHNLEVCYILLSIAYKRANDSQMSLNTVSHLNICLIEIVN